MSTKALDRPRTAAARWLGLLVFAAAVIIVAVLGGLAAANAASEYAGLDKPAWAPPSWLFGPVWTALYVMIAVAGWRVWARAGLGPAIAVYAIQLALNAAWTPVFFGANRYGPAVLIIVALWLSIAATVVMFRRVDRAAAWLLVPYWAWVTFATALNIAVWSLNR